MIRLRVIPDIDNGQRIKLEIFKTVIFGHANGPRDCT